jgi:catechol 2,3-dioxygenase-like lactoylglutathione lyase family enzyme
MFTGVIEGLFETHLEVKNLELAREFYENTLGLKLAHFEQKRRIAFYTFGTSQAYMLGVWEKATHEWKRGHFAFRINPEKMLKVYEHLTGAGLKPRNFLDDDSGQLYVFPWLPAVSVYFEDLDGNSLEFLAMLPEPPRPDLALMNWEDWKLLKVKV